MRDLLTSFDAPNPRLWVRLAPGWTPDPGMRWLIAGSSQTHRGHFQVCSEVGDHHLSVNLDDVVETSPDAAVWLDGFLQGQQATLWQFLGEDPRLMSARDEDDERRLDDWNRRFLQQGSAPSDLSILPERDVRLTDLGTPLPWCYVGDLYLVWSGVDWTPADPQPGRTDWPGGFWPGSECQAEGVHEMVAHDDLNVLYCARCHVVDQGLPDDV